MQAGKIKIGVLGCGAIGSILLGRLHQQKQNVVGVVRTSQINAIKQFGLELSGIQGNHTSTPPVCTKLYENVDIAIIATKTYDMEEIIKSNLSYMKDSIVVFIQNGFTSERIAQKYFSKNQLYPAIILFGANFTFPNKSLQTTSGNIVIGENRITSSVSEIFTHTIGNSFALSYANNIKAAKFLKLFINLSYAIPALLGIGNREAFNDIFLAKIAMHLRHEAFNIVQQHGIELEDLPGFPAAIIHSSIRKPIIEAAQDYSNAIAGLSTYPIYGSLLQSLKKGSETEIESINGEIVSLAKKKGIPAFYNKQIISLVHQTEKSGCFITKKKLIKAFNE